MFKKRKNEEKIFSKNIKNGSLVDAELKKDVSENMECTGNVATDVEQTSLNKLVIDTINLNSAFDIYYFARSEKNLPKEVVELLADAIIKTGNMEFIIRFASNIENAPLEKIAIAIINSNSALDIYDFSFRVKNLSKEVVELLADALINIGDMNCIQWFAFNIANAPLKKLTIATINSNDPSTIWSFARTRINFSKEEVELLADALIKTGNMYYIRDYICYAENVPIEKLQILIQGNILDKDTKIVISEALQEREYLQIMEGGIAKKISCKSDEFRCNFINYLQQNEPYSRRKEQILEVYYEYLLKPEEFSDRDIMWLDHKFCQVRMSKFKPMSPREEERIREKNREFWINLSNHSNQRTRKH